jgi:formyl-CoA transferase
VLLDAHWRKLARAIGRPEAADDPRYATALERIARRAEVDGWLAEWAAGLDVEEAVRRLAELGVPAAPVRSYAEASRDPHVAARDMLRSVAQEDGTPAPIVGPPAKLSRTPIDVRRAAPALGEHTEELLAELGLDAGARRALLDAGIAKAVPTDGEPD